MSMSLWFSIGPTISPEDTGKGEPVPAESSKAFPEDPWHSSAKAGASPRMRVRKIPRIKGVNVRLHLVEPGAAIRLNNGGHPADAEGASKLPAYIFKLLSGAFCQGGAGARPLLVLN